MTRPAGRPIHMQFDAPMCSSGKRPFPTEAAARAQLGKARAVRAAHGGYKPGRVEKRCYQCPVCQCWHLTSKAKR